MTADGSWRQLGCRIEITSMEHSPTTTRALGSRLIGATGRVVAHFRPGVVALIELDGPQWDLPQGVRRWSMHWDDLTPHPERCAEPSPAYWVGLSGLEREAVQHAMRDSEETALCGDAAYPLPFTGWSLPFASTSARACPTCAWLIGAGLCPSSAVGQG